MKTTSEKQDYWRSAANHYGNWDSPLSPIQEDLDILRSEVLEIDRARQTERLKVLQLGVTPGITRLDWPSSTDLLSVDRSRTMIEMLWPRDLAADGVMRCVLQRDWRDLNSTVGRFHLVISDGPFHNMPDVANYLRLRDVLHELLLGRGRVVARFFMQPEVQESPSTLVNRMHAGEFSSFHAFKFCLLMALQPRPDVGTLLNDVWEFWTSLNIDHEELGKQQGWPVKAIDTMRAYRGKDTRLCFLCAEHVEQLLRPRFEIKKRHRSSYPLGDRCPIYVLEAVDAGPVPREDREALTKPPDGSGDSSYLGGFVRASK
jgi:hypothetical protein